MAEHDQPLPVGTADTAPDLDVTVEGQALSTEAAESDNPGTEATHDGNPVTPAFRETYHDLTTGVRTYIDQYRGHMGQLPGESVAGIFNRIGERVSSDRERAVLELVAANQLLALGQDLSQGMQQGLQAKVGESMTLLVGNDPQTREQYATGLQAEERFAAAARAQGGNLSGADVGAVFGPSAELAGHDATTAAIGVALTSRLRAGVYRLDQDAERMAGDFTGICMENLLREPAAV